MNLEQLLPTVGSRSIPFHLVPSLMLLRQPSDYAVAVIVPSARQLAEYSLECQHPLTRTWVDDATRVDLLARQNEQVDVLLATDLEIAAARVARFAPGDPPETMLNRWVPIRDNLYAMLSMRFEVR